MLLPELVAFGRFVGGLRRFLRHRLDADECRRRIVHNLQEREASFLRLIGQGVFARRDSAYRKLFAHAGVSFEDVCDLVARRGLEQALATLFDAGVYLRLDEFKGRRPIRRGSLVLEVEPHDFDNPLSAKHFASQSGGSRGSGTRTYIDLDGLAHDAGYQHFELAAFGLRDRPLVLWCPPPPYSAAFNELLRAAKLGQAAGHETKT
jgi:hypothetical protein